MISPWCRHRMSPMLQETEKWARKSHIFFSSFTMSPPVLESENLGKCQNPTGVRRQASRLSLTNFGFQLSTSEVTSWCYSLNYEKLPPKHACTNIHALSSTLFAIQPEHNREQRERKVHSGLKIDSSRSKIHNPVPFYIWHQSDFPLGKLIIPPDWFILLSP